MFEKLSLLILPIFIITVLTVGMLKKVPIYEEFTEGAKDGFNVAISIIPYLVALIVGISMFRASGAIDLIANTLSSLLNTLSIPVDVIPIMITRSLSGSATLGIFAEIVTKNGAESYAAMMAAVMVGSSETTFYVLSVYFGSIGIKKFRYAILAGIIADITGIILAVLVARYFFLPNIA
ncbi:MAG: spore maturation protein [bacterium]|nr:spore maturation protein [bacterium]